MKGFLVGLLLVAFAPQSTAQLFGKSDELLEPEKAFRFSARALNDGAIEVHFAIADGYYMYRERFRFDAQGANARLGKPEFPPGIAHKDEFFGEMQIYRKAVRIRVPAQGAGALDLKVTSQGCADVGVCYVPMESSASLRLGCGGGRRDPQPHPANLLRAISRSRACSRTARRWCSAVSWCSGCCSRSRPACCR